MSVHSSIIKSVQMRHNDQLEVVNFISQSASLSVKLEKTTQGVLKKHILSFRIAGIDNQSVLLIGRINDCRNFTVRDSHGFITEIGKYNYPPKISIERETSGTAGGFRGYSITITWNSL